MTNTAGSPISFSNAPKTPPDGRGFSHSGATAADSAAPSLGAVETNDQTGANLFGHSPQGTLGRKSKRRRKIEARWSTNAAADWQPRTREDQHWAKQIEYYDGTKRMPPPEIIPATHAETNFRHSGWMIRREQMRRAMIAAGEAGRSIQAFDACGAHAWVEEYTDDAGGFRLKAQYCKSRWCKPCQKAHALLLADNLRERLGNTNALHIVLTVRHYDAPLTDQLTRLFEWFKQLRKSRVWFGRRKLFPARMPKQCNTPARKKRWQAARHALTFRWQSHTTGGAAFFQTHVGRDGLWHNHFHIVAEGTWMPQRTLSRAWSKITGGSTDASVSKVGNAQSIVREVTRYAARPVDDDKVQDHDKLVELVCGLRGRRLCFTYGKWRGFALGKAPPKSDRPTRSVGRLTDLIARADAGEVHARHILDILLTKSCAAHAPPEDQHYL